FCIHNVRIPTPLRLNCKTNAWPIPQTGKGAEHFYGHHQHSAPTRRFPSTCHTTTITSTTKITNRHIGWAIKTTNQKKLGLDPACGVLDLKEGTLGCSSDVFDYGLKNANNDRITVGWRNTFDGATE
ncbi:hypothetical protein TELCIR_09033, partial [Teladorsagia circumcincta]